MRGNACQRKRAVSGFKVMGKGISKEVRISNNLTINFQMCKIILPLRVRNMFKKSQQQQQQQFLTINQTS